YRTRPLIDGPALAIKGKVLPKQAADFDVTSAVAADGTYDFAVDSTSSDWVRYGSREATSGKPQLLIALVQNLAPLVTITAPAPSATVDLGAAVTFSATAVDAESGDLGARIVWASDRDGILGSGTSITTASLSHGPHTITARATDAGGRSGEAWIAIVVASPPILTIIAPADGTAFVPGAAVTFSAAASDVDVGDLSGSITWTSSLDGPLGSGGALDVSTLRSGTHTITAAVADSGGKTAEARTTVVVNTPPQLRIVAPTDRSVLVPGDLVRFEGTAADVEDGDLSAAVTWTSSVDGPLGTGGTLSVSLRSGTHTITASVADRGGKTASGALTVVVNAPPVLAITSPADGFDSVPGAAIIFTASASDTEDGSLDAAIRWSSSLDGPLGAGPT